jgi:hypothetical protein
LTEILPGGLSLFAPSLTVYIKTSDNPSETGIMQGQTFVCGRAKGAPSVDVMRGEIVEAELDRLIERRSVKEPDPDEREELWKESVRAYMARRSEEMRAAWREYHQGQAARHRGVLEALIARHEAAAERLAP